MWLYIINDVEYIYTRIYKCDNIFEQKDISEQV